MLVNRPALHLSDLRRDAPWGHLLLDLQHVLARAGRVPGRDAANRVIVTEQAFLERVLAAREAVETLEHVVVSMARRRQGRSRSRSSRRWAIPTSTSRRPGARSSPRTCSALIYTSGTTGPPKGVQLTHANMVAEWRGLRRGLADRAGRAHDLLPALAPTSPTAGPALRADVLRQTASTAAPTRARWSPTRPRCGRPLGRGAADLGKLKVAMEAAIAAEPDEPSASGDGGGDGGRPAPGRRLMEGEVPAELQAEWQRADERGLRADAGDARARPGRRRSWSARRRPRRR